MSERAQPASLRRAGLVALVCAAAALGCDGSTEPAAFDPAEIAEVVWENLAPVPNTNVDAAPQPRRLQPYDVALVPGGRVALVALRGTELEPGSEVAVVDVQARTVAARLDVGARPVAVAVHPGGRYAVVLSQLSPFAAVIDVVKLAVVGRIEVGYYAEDLAFLPSGDRMLVTNRAGDTVTSYTLSHSREGLRGEAGISAPAGTNPSSLGLSPDGAKAYVCDLGGLGLRVFDTATLEERARIPLDAPAFDVAAMGPWMVVTTLNDTRGLPCAEDSDFVGQEGDGVYPIVTDRTCSRGFADIQNEIAFVDTETDEVVVRYTSDTAEVSEADREGDHDPALMRVRGSLPQSIAVVSPQRAYVTMGSSHEVVELTLAEEGGVPAMNMPRAFSTGFAPRGVVVTEDGLIAIVADKLGDSISFVDLVTGETQVVPVSGSEPAFPATSAEIGELFAHSSRFSTDGDQSCVHCHPDNQTDAKAWGVGVVRAFGRRSTLPLRNLFDTTPLLVEGVFEATDFSLEMEAMSFRPDFHDSSYTLQVERRDDFFRETSRDLFGVEVGFDAMVLHVAEFLMVEPRLLPSPFDASTDAVERGKALFERPDVACASCHPAPTFASERVFEGVVTLGRYDLPRRDLDPDVSIKYIEQAQDGFFNANSLRGVWDRPGALLHDGRAVSLREVVLTPGHPCLSESERAYNEFGGQVDTNGGISALTCPQVDDLLAYLTTID